MPWWLEHFEHTLYGGINKMARLTEAIAPKGI
jgi:hypothetical protein